MHRRQFLRLGSALAASALVAPSLWSRALAEVVSGTGPYGPLQPPDENGIELPRGFRSRVLAEALKEVPGTRYPWHVFPDGGATFAMSDRGWVYVSNSEFFVNAGVGALRFDRHGTVVDAYPILEGSLINCAGGKTPWGTWLSCEEFPSGHVFECDPTGRVAAQVRPGLGTFQHEAAAVDPETGIVYLTEDVRDGGFYRFVPNAWGNLSSGQLQIAQVTPFGTVRWHDVPVPNPTSIQTGTRHQVAASAPFNGGEGIVESRGRVYFTTKGDNRVWDYDPAGETIRILYDDDSAPGLPLSGVDNITASGSGDLLVAEDGGNMELVIITPDLEIAPILRVVDQGHSELAGPAFDPSGRRLYVSSQRGGDRAFGITYEITGPFRRSRGRAAPGRLRRGGGG